jgi:hypothetical protein
MCATYLGRRLAREDEKRRGNRGKGAERKGYEIRVNASVRLEILLSHSDVFSKQLQGSCSSTREGEMVKRRVREGGDRKKGVRIGKWEGGDGKK